MNFDPNTKYNIISNGDKTKVLSHRPGPSHPIVSAEPANGSLNQQWYFRDGYLVNAATNTAVTVDHDGSTLVLVGQAGAPDQMWRFEYGVIVSNANGNAIELTGPYDIGLRPRHGAPSQSFTVTPATGFASPVYTPPTQIPSNPAPITSPPAPIHVAPAGTPQSYTPGGMVPGGNHEMQVVQSSPMPSFPSTQNADSYLNQATKSDSDSDSEKKDKIYKPPKNPILKVILTIKFFASPVISLVFLIIALSTFLALIQLFSQFQTLTDDFSRKPVVEFAIANSADCPSGFDPIENLGVWGGIKKGCNCSAVTSFQAAKYKGVTAGEVTFDEKVCTTNQTKAGCTAQPGVDPVKLNQWKFSTSGASRRLCEKRGGRSLFELIPMPASNTCPSGMQICGGSTGNITEHTHCSDTCGLTVLRFTDSVGSISLTTSSAGNSYPVSRFQMTEGPPCTVGTPGTKDSDSRYRSSSAVGNAGSGCTEVDPLYSELAKAKLSDLLLANGLDINSHSLSSVLQEVVPTTIEWGFYMKRQRAWNCTPQYVKETGLGDIIEPSAFQKNMVAVHVIFGVQVSLFVISCLTTIILSLCIPGLLIYNGYLRKIWCGFHVLREADRDDIERYNLIALAVSFIFKIIKFIPLIVCIVVAYQYQSFYSRLKKGKCSDWEFQQIINSYADKMSSTTGVLNWVMFVLGLLSFLGTLLSCGVLGFKVVKNKIQGKDAFDRGVRFHNDGKGEINA